VLFTRYHCEVIKSRILMMTRHVTLLGEVIHRCKILLGNFKGRDHSEYIMDVDWMIMLKCIVKK